MKARTIVILLFFVCSWSILFAQEKVVKSDTLKTESESSVKLSDMSQSGTVFLKLPRTNPIENLQPQFTPYNRITITRPYYIKSNKKPTVQWDGSASDFINTKSRTAIASISPTSAMTAYSAVTLGLVETPQFGKANYYILNSGIDYSVNARLNLGLRAGYNSNLGVLPYWNISADATYAINPNLTIDGSVNYVRTAGNMFNLTQSAVLVDLHGRYRLSDDWYLNAYGGMPVSQTNNQPSRPLLPMMNTPYYGGSVEYWFQPTMGVEGGVIWMRDMFSGKMRPQPKLELKFRPDR